MHHQGLSDPVAHGCGARRDRRGSRQHGPRRLALAHVRYRQGCRLARRPGCHRISVPQCAGGGLRARTFRNAVQPHRRRAHLPAAVRRHDHEIRRRPTGPAHLRRSGPHRSCHAPHALRPVGPALGQVLRRVFRARPHHGRRRLPGRHGTVARGRQPASLPGPQDDSGDRRLRAGLLHVHLGPHLHRRRQRHGAARRAAAAGHGVRAIPPDRHLRRRRPHHGRIARRRRLPHQFGGRAVHGALRPPHEGPGIARRGVAIDDDRDPRGTGHRAGARPHPSPSRASRSEGAARAAARHLGACEDLLQCRRDPRSDPGAADRPLQHGRNTDELSRRGPGRRQGRPGEDRARPAGDRRGGLRVGARRQPAGIEFAHRPSRVRQGGGHQMRRGRRSALLACGPAEGCGRRRHSAARRISTWQGRHADRRDAAAHAEGDAGLLRGLPDRRGARRRLPPGRRHLEEASATYGSATGRWSGTRISSRRSSSTISSPRPRSRRKAPGRGPRAAARMRAKTSRTATTRTG